jgi:hypothetical protein
MLSLIASLAIATPVKEIKRVHVVHPHKVEIKRVHVVRPLKVEIKQVHLPVMKAEPKRIIVSHPMMGK